MHTASVTLIQARPVETRAALDRREPADRDVELPRLVFAKQTSEEDEEGEPREEPENGDSGAGREVVEESGFGGDTLSAPYGRQSYPFETPPPLGLPTGHQELSKEAKWIVEAYERLCTQRAAIKESLEGFNWDLTQNSNTELVTSFQSLKDIAGFGTRIELVKEGGEPSRIVLDEMAWDNLVLKGYHQVVFKFNSALSNSEMFLQMEGFEVSKIHDDLDEMQRCGIKDRASSQLHDVLREVPGRIEGFREEILRLLHDIDIAKVYLKDRRVNTGMLIKL